MIFTGGIVGMTISFFVNLWLLGKGRLPLSFLFPFQGLSVIIVTLGASVFLKERLTFPLVVGALLVTAGRAAGVSELAGARSCGTCAR